MEKSQEHFRRAIELQPDYAPAYAGLADTYILLGVLYLNPPHDTFPKAKQYAEKALQLDEALAEAHKSLASVMNLYDWNFQGAERHFLRALELNPSLSSAHQGYSVLLTCLQRYEEAISEILKARELDPLSVAVNAFVGFIYMRARRFSEALGACRRAIELDPTILSLIGSLPARSTQQNRFRRRLWSHVWRPPNLGTVLPIQVT